MGPSGLLAMLGGRPPSVLFPSLVPPPSFSTFAAISFTVR